MYGYEWTEENGVYRLSVSIPVQKEIRPVFKEELDFFGLHKYWKYPSDARAPLLWAEGIRRYVLNGECVAEAVGGGFYTKPEVKVYREDLSLAPVDLDALWRENERLMLGLEKTAVDFIRKVHDQYAAQGMAFVVAFSGGKDSLALLDLAAKALAPDEFYVIFSNTGMELSVTLEAVKRAKKRWPALRFYEAKSHMTPEESWEEFGPPGRRLRWCCSVHKSVPTILLLRELTGNYNVKAVVFDGVRAEESAQRAGYEEISVGAKNINQINCSPIHKWNSAELFVHILHNDLLLNSAYKTGMFRVGCIVCPLSSNWWDGIAGNLYSREVRPFLYKVEKYARRTKSLKERRKFIEQGGWKARIGGRGLDNGGNRVIEKIEDDKITFSFLSQRQSWLDVCPILGPVVAHEGDRYSQLIDGRQLYFTVSEDSVTYWPYSQTDRFIVSHLRGVANKTAYCVGCRACEVQCPVDAFVIGDKGKIYIREERCIHCCNCIEFTHGKGCLAAKSLSTSGGGSVMNLKGMNRYQHFGFRQEWLSGFFEERENYFTLGKIGNRQYDALRVWLKEAGLMEAPGKGAKAGVPTPLFEKLEPLGPDHPLTWAVIWTNLAYNSIIVKWYMLCAPAGEVYEKGDLVSMLGDDYSPSTRDNAVTALLETLRHSPIGSVLRQGIPIQSGRNYRYSKQGWNPPEGVAVLYALYRWAEATERRSFTLAQLAAARGNMDLPGVDPVSVFALNPEDFRETLRDIALSFGEKYLRTAFVADLDNVTLSPELSSLDILDMAAKS